MEKNEYKNLTKEKIEDLLKDVMTPIQSERKLNIMGYDSRGNIVPIEQTSAFDEAMKNHVKEFQEKLAKESLKESLDTLDKIEKQWTETKSG